MLTHLLRTLLFIIPISLQAYDISSSGTIAFTVDASSLTSGAGSNLSYVETAVDVNTLDVTDATGIDWIIDIAANLTDYPTGHQLWAKVTTNGSGATGLSVESDYVILTGTHTEIARGTGNHSGMKLQYKLTGLTLSNFVEQTIEAGTYPNNTIDIRIDEQSG